MLFSKLPGCGSEFRRPKNTLNSDEPRESDDNRGEEADEGEVRLSEEEGSVVNFVSDDDVDESGESDEMLARPADVEEQMLADSTVTAGSVADWHMRSEWEGKRMVYLRTQEPCTVLKVHLDDDIADPYVSFIVQSNVTYCLCSSPSAWQPGMKSKPRANT
jgi:hypothetical protein